MLWVTWVGNFGVLWVRWGETWGYCGYVEWVAGDVVGALGKGVVGKELRVLWVP